MIVGRAYERLEQLLEGEHDAALAAAAAPAGSRLERLEQLLRVRQTEETLESAKPRTAGRPPTPRSELEKIAQVYSDAYYNGQPPTQAVATYLGCNAKTAARRIALCRKRGVLLKTEQGVAGGIPIAMRRGTAGSLRVLVENEKRREMVRESQATAAAEGDPDCADDREDEP